MAEDIVDLIDSISDLGLPGSTTGLMPLFGAPQYRPQRPSMWAEESEKDSENHLVDFLDYSFADIRRAVREEWACTVEDVLSRRSRLLLLDVKKAVEIAPIVASVMAQELGQDKNWETEQVQSFNRLAERYFPA
jgi:glycerol-3-phosphate dehydrogenase